MSIKPEFVALMMSDKELFKKELYSILEDKMSIQVSNKYIDESEKLFEHTKIEPKPVIIKEAVIEPSKKVYMPINEVNSAITFNRTHWMTARDGSSLELTPQMAKYLAELYNSLNSLHKDKLV